MFFSSFLLILIHIFLDLLSLGNAEAHIGWGGNLNDHLIATCQEYSYQNYQNLVIVFQVTVKNVGDVFLGRSVEMNHSSHFWWVSLCVADKCADDGRRQWNCAPPCCFVPPQFVADAVDNSTLFLRGCIFNYLQPL